MAKYQKFARFQPYMVIFWSTETVALKLFFNVYTNLRIIDSAVCCCLKETFIVQLRNYDAIQSPAKKYTLAAKPSTQKPGGLKEKYAVKS